MISVPGNSSLARTEVIEIKRQPIISFNIGKWESKIAFQMTANSSSPTKLDIVDVILLVVLQVIFPIPLNIFLGFFPFGRAFGFLIGSFFAGMIFALFRKGKRPLLLVPRERVRLARSATLVLLVLSILFCLLELVLDVPFSPPLIGAPQLGPKSLILATLIGVPLQGLLLFLVTRLGLRIGMGGQPIQPGFTAPSPQPAGKALVVLLVLQIACITAAIFQDVSALPVFSRIRDTIEMGSVWWVWLSWFAMICLFLANGVIFLVWLHRSYKNLLALRAEGLTFTPGWAVGWWFIPIMNVFKPYQVVKELWKASDPSFDLKNARSWKEAPSTLLIPFWWAFWLLSTVKVTLSGASINPQNVKVLTWVSLGTHTAYLIAGILLILLVRTISKRHEQLRARVNDF